MGRQIALIEAVVVFFGSWTISYHVVLFARLPASFTMPLCLTALLLIGRLFIRKWRTLWRQNDSFFALKISAISAVTGSLALVNFRPDADDIEFFHRALIQIYHLNQPWFLTDTIHNMMSLPPLSILHVTTSYEPLMAITAKILQVEPVWFYQNIGAFLAALLLPMVYAALYIEFGISRRVAVVCVLLSIIFLMLDGNMHRSFGNVSLVRFWQGKTILWSLLIPLATFAIHRFLISPSKRRFVLLCLVCVSGIGLSNAAVYLLPLLAAGMSMAFLFSYGFSPYRLLRAVASGLPSLYCLAFGVAAKLGFLPLPDMTIWQWVEKGWISNLWLVIGSRAVLVRDLFILAIIPMICLRGRNRFFFLVLGITFSLIFLNPVTGPLWVDALTPNNYWRLLYLFPLPWCAGLIARTLMREGKVRPGKSRVWAVPALVLLCGLGFQAPAVSVTRLKFPSEYNFPRPVVTFCLSVRDIVDNRQVLACPEIAEVLPLINPSLRVESHRPQSTLHIFRSAGLPSEGHRRFLAQSLVGAGCKSEEAGNAFQVSLERGINAVITRESFIPLVLEELGPQKENWSVVAVSAGFGLLLKNTKEK